MIKQLLVTLSCVLLLLNAPAYAIPVEKLDLKGAQQTLNEEFKKAPVFRTGNVEHLQPGKPFTDPSFIWNSGYVWPHAAKGILKGSYWTSNAGTADVNPTGDTLANLPKELSPFVWNGTFNITPKVLPKKYKDTVDPKDGSARYISGAINSYPYCQKYGVFSIFAMLPDGKGTWPAFWLLPKNMTWPPELDIMEVLGKDIYKDGKLAYKGNRVLYNTIHIPKKPQLGNFYYSPTPLTGTWHEFSVDWGPKVTKFYLDRNLTHSFPTPPEMNGCMYILVNYALGEANSWSGAPEPKTTWFDWYRIKSIKVWQRPEYISSIK